MRIAPHDRNSTSASASAGLVYALLALMLVGLTGLTVLSPPSLAGTQEQIQERQTTTGPGNALGDKSPTDMWRAIRHGAPGTVSQPQQGRSVLIQGEGTTWQDRRSRIMVDYGAKLLGVVVAIIAVYFLLRGRIKITGGRTGRVIPRFTLIQRIAHWSVAVLFVLLGVSGLILLLGRTLLRPYISNEVFAALASASMQGHNLFAPLFIPAILALFFLFLRGNGVRLIDLKWLAKGGGFFGGHASSHKYNFGEKTWFWWSVILGLALCASGLLMLFPALSPGRTTLQLANLVHAGAALLFIAFGIGHVYLGTIGMEGALEGMTIGTVDENWAREHHDLWHEENKETATSDHTRAEVIAAARGDALSEGAAE